MKKFSLFFLMLLAMQNIVKADNEITITYETPVVDNAFIPMYGYFMDAVQKCQFIYTADKLTGIIGANITSLSFKGDKANNAALWQQTVHVRLASTTLSDLSAGWATDEMTKVYQGLVSLNADSILHIQFATPFLYEGGNLLVMFDVPEDNSESFEAVNFKGFEKTTASRHSFGGNYPGAGFTRNFIPKVTIGYVDADVEVFYPVTDLTATVDANTVHLTWNGPVKGKNVTYSITKDGVELATAITETIYADNNAGIGEHEYCVVAVYANGSSVPICVAATVTELDCPGITNLLCAVVGGTTVEMTWTPPSNGKNNIILSEGFENGIPATWTQIDADGDGHIWTIDPATEGGMNPYTGYFSEKCANSVSWDAITQNAVTPDNYLITPLVEGARKVTYMIGSDATPWFIAEHYAVMVSTTGTAVSDFTIVFEETLEVKGNGEYPQDNMKRSSAPKEPWKQRTVNLPVGTKYIAFRHFNCSDKYILKLDDVVVSVGDPDLTDYTYTVTRNGEVIAEGLTSPNYTDSNLDAGNYDYCVKVVYENCTSVPHCAAMLGITDSDCPGITDLTASYENSVVDLTWTAPPSDNGSYILSENFESGALPTGWLVIDADGDGYNWDAEYGAGIFVGHGGGNCISSASYINNIGALTPDNYLVTPLIAGGITLHYWTCVQDASWCGEYYAVMASNTGTDVADFSIIFEELMTAKFPAGDKGLRGSNEQGQWYERIINLPAGTKYVAFRHFNTTDAFWLNLDDVTVYGGKALPPNYTYTVTRNGEVIAEGLTSPNYSDENPDEGLYEYCVLAVYPDCTSTPVCKEVLVDHGHNDCDPVTNLSTTVVDTDVEITWTAPQNMGKDAILTEGFETTPLDGIPEGWTIIDADGDTHNWYAQGSIGSYSPHTGDMYMVSKSFSGGTGLNPDNYLITPSVAGATSITYWVCVSPVYPGEHYAIMASSTGTNVEDFTLVFEETLTGTSKGATYSKNDEEYGKATRDKVHPWFERSVTLPVGTKYIAFRHFNTFDKLYLSLDDITVYGGEVEIPDFTYILTKDGVEIASGFSTPSYTDENGVGDGNSHEYCVTVVYNVCTSEAACTRVIVGIENVTAGEVKVYPNPATNLLNIQGDIQYATMYNSLGQAVKTAMFNNQINVSTLANGVYYLVMNLRDGAYVTQKVVIAK